ncbi:aldose 1-epimerase [Paenibacillus koleovorans]|uniref:aldose 1-epimerase n=1 Tax=Paenibacillus koleovorans TaxID=121608 RepID=UPI000FD76875|nr:aldose 1-epimerase [Paenibacillus koleovorans]
MSIVTGTWQGVPAVTLENDFFAATLLPTIGSNMIRMWDKVAEREILRVPDTLASIQEQPGHYGIPMMMPPNRIRHGAFEFEGRPYQLAINTPVGHHIHGILRTRPWIVVHTSDIDGKQTITTQFRTTDFPELADQYPHDLTMNVTYTLSEHGLYQEIESTNHSELSAPFGFGVHTWFRIDGEPGKWTFQLPVESIWELDADAMPTGNLLPLTALFSAMCDKGINLEGSTLDTVFQIGANPVDSVLSKSDYTIRYSASEDFKQWVIYTKGAAQDTICIEPYTWVTNAPNLPLDPSVTGMSALAPGETRKLWIDLQISRS